MGMRMGMMGVVAAVVMRMMRMMVVENRGDVGVQPSASSYPHSSHSHSSDYRRVGVRVGGCSMVKRRRRN